MPACEPVRILTAPGGAPGRLPARFPSRARACTAHSAARAPAFRFRAPFSQSVFALRSSHFCAPFLRSVFALRFRAPFSSLSFCAPILRSDFALCFRAPFFCAPFLRSVFGLLLPVPIAMLLFAGERQRRGGPWCVGAIARGLHTPSLDHSPALAGGLCSSRFSYVVMICNIECIIIRNIVVITEQ